MTAIYIHLIRATFGWRDRTPDEITAAAADIDRIGWDTAFPAVHAVFALAVERRWSAPAELDQVVATVRATKAQLPASTRFHPLLAEGVIRCALGEHELIQGLPVETVGMTELLLLGRLVEECRLTDTDFATLLSEVHCLQAAHA